MSTQAVVFTLGSEKFGVNISNIDSIERYNGLSNVPSMPPYVLGVINLHGSIVPTISLRYFIKQSETHDYTNDDGRILVCSKGALRVGFAVNSAQDVINIEEEQVDKTVKSRYMDGIAKLEDGTLLVLINLVKILNDDSFNTLKQLNND